MTQPPAAIGASETPADSSLFVQSLARGLSVLEAFDAQHRSLTLSQVAARTGLSRAAARRLLHTLVELGFAELVDAQFSLTPRVLRLGWGYLSGQSFPSLAGPVLRRLSGRLGESASAAELVGTDVVYVARAEVKRIMRVNITVGTHFPAAWTSMGRVLLAELDPQEQAAAIEASLPLAPPSAKITDPEQLAELLAGVRVAGWCQIDQELEPGLRSVAVPVRSPDGRSAYALNVSLRSDAGESAEQARDRVLPALLDAAAELEQALALA